MPPNEPEDDKQKIKPMAKADYTYTIENYSGLDVIAIIDMDLGKTSLTNDIENVIPEICRLENISAEDFIIVYKDSTGTWDAYEYIKEKFVILNAETWQEAVDRYIRKVN